MYYGNGIYNIGPNLNNGGFAANNPSGAKFLIGNSSSEPSLAPYQFVRVWASAIFFRFIPVTASGPAFYTISVIPGNQPASSIGTESLGLVGEQAYSRNRFVGKSFTGSYIGIKHFMTTRKIFGIKNKAAIEGDENYSHNYNNFPVKAWYWNVWINGDASTNMTGNVMCEVTYMCEFFTRQTLFSSTAPSFDEKNVFNFEMEPAEFAEMKI